MHGLALLARYAPVLLLWFGLHAYVAWRLLEPAQLVGMAKVAGWAGAVVIASLPLAALICQRAALEGPGFTLLYWVGFTTLGFASILIASVLVRDGFAVVIDIVRRVTGTEPPDDERRRFLLNAVNLGLVGGSATLTTVGVAKAVADPPVKKVDVPIADLDPRLEGFTIVQLSDLHVGPTVRAEHVREIVEEVNALEPDLVALTGDFVDGHVQQLRDQVAPLADLASRHGSYFVTGNHEYYWDARAWTTAFRKLGITALENEHRVIDHEGANFVVAGVHDLDAERHDPEHRSDPQKALRGAPEGFRLLLAHQPRSVFAAERAAGYHLQLSGHTHGGQYFPFNLVVWLVQPYLAGLHRAANLWIYVSRGVAYWGPPVRVGAPKEISLLRLTRA